MKVLQPSPVSGDGTLTRASPATYINSAGLMVSAGVDVPRVNYNAATLALEGLLIERASTNLCTYSEDATNGVWSTFSAMVITGATGIGPDGANTLATFTDPSIVDFSTVQRSFTASASQRFCASVYILKDAVPAATRFSLLRIEAVGPTPGQNIIDCRLDTQTGYQVEVIFSPSGKVVGSSGVQDCGLFWRLWCSFACSDVLTNSYTLSFWPAVGADPSMVSYSASTTGSVKAGYWQFELGEEPTSYIPATGASPVTRAADIPAGTGLLYSNAPEPGAGEAAWSAATNYSLADVVVRSTTHRRYKNTLAGVDAGLPEATPARWLDIGPSNRWAMFDDVVGTATEMPNQITTAFAAGLVSAIALLDLVGRFVNVTVASGSETVYSTTIDLEESVVEDWYGYFFEPFSTMTQAILTDLPPYVGATIGVTITGGGDVSVGVVAVGAAYDIGDLQYGASVGIIDYSRKEVDPDFGTTTLVQRAFSKRMSGTLMQENAQLNRIRKLMEGLRATPCVWIGTDDDTYGPLVVFGFYRDFSQQIAYPTQTLMSLEIEGMI